MSDAVDGRSAARCRNTIVVCATKRHFSTDLTKPVRGHSGVLWPLAYDAPGGGVGRYARPA
eukprot:4953060-Prymnesium_polylepis.1